MNPQQRQPIPARLLLVGLQLALELIHPRSKLRHRLDLALVAVRGLIAPHHLAHRVLRNPQIPGDLLDRNAPSPDDPDGSVRSFPLPASPPPRLSKQRGVLKITKPGGVNFGRRLPHQGGQYSTPINNVWSGDIWGMCNLAISEDSSSDIVSIMHLFIDGWSFPVASAVLLKDEPGELPDTLGLKCQLHTPRPVRLSDVLSP